MGYSQLELFQRFLDAVGCEATPREVWHWVAGEHIDHVDAYEYTICREGGAVCYIFDRGTEDLVDTMVIPLSDTGEIIFNED